MSEQQQRNQTVAWLLLLVSCTTLGYVAGKAGWPGAWLPTLVAPAAKVTAATYFFPNRGSVPAPVQAGISELNSMGIVATTHEEGTTNAAGQVPEQHKHSYPMALKEGLPCLVIIRSDGTTKAVKGLLTKQQVVEAVK